MPLRLCSTCGLEPALKRKQRCFECDEAAQPVIIRVRRVEARLALIPEQCRRLRVPEKDWPFGRRFCAGCQSFVRLIDCPKGGSRCRTCTGISGHEQRIKAAFGLSKDDWNHLMNVQGGRCAICRNPPKTKRFDTDHNHQTGEVRGLLCSRCNDELLSACYHKVEVLENAIAYLTNPPMTAGWVQPEVRRGEPEPAPF